MATTDNMIPETSVKLSLARGLRRDGTTIGLLFASLTGIVGSGWLLGPMETAQVAGPYGVWSWAIGGILILSLALCYAELGPLIPRSGSAVHISRVGNGPMLAMVWTWILFLGYVTTAPTEVVAIVTYANNYIPGLLAVHSSLLSGLGFIVSAGLMMLLAAINLLRIGTILNVSRALMVVKLIIPLLTIVLFLSFAFHPENLHVAADHHATYMQGMFSSIATTGIVFSYLGFRQAVELGGEAKRPQVSVPVGVIFSVVTAIIIYVALQYAFLLGVDPKYVAQKGWENISFPGINGPFAAIAGMIGLGWLGYLLYADALVSPAGTAMMYTTTSSRITMAIGELYPKKPTGNLRTINKTGTPFIAVLAVVAVGLLFLIPFPSWQKMTTYVASVTSLSYGLGPVVLLQMRRAAPDVHRPFRLWGASIIAPFAFIAANLIIFWSGVQTLDFLFGMLLLFLLLAIAWFYITKRNRELSFGWKYGWWLVPYFGGMWVLTKLGPSSAVGGIGWISFYWDMAFVALYSLFILWLALRCAVPHEESRAYLEQLGKMPDLGV
ncbi:APC family permease [Acidithiobacillus sp. AMEEHan]|uniref:APC family permease n=1 Tax=Acidithiobacillus sp. AMEEHan TaxID=2994951 RepID=UPI0027E4A8D7|nr:APC family permease [Acidithiobacillus sp. AMEEHan]